MILTLGHKIMEEPTLTTILVLLLLDKVRPGRQWLSRMSGRPALATLSGLHDINTGLLIEADLEEERRWGFFLHYACFCVIREVYSCAIRWGY